MPSSSARAPVADPAGAAPRSSTGCGPRSATTRRSPASPAGSRPRRAIIPPQFPLRHGRGPTSDISPAITCHNCGSSSIECRRQKRAKRVGTRGSAALFSSGPGFVVNMLHPAGRRPLPMPHMVRNFSIHSVRPAIPRAGAQSTASVRRAARSPGAHQRSRAAPAGAAGRRQALAERYGLPVPIGETRLDESGLDANSSTYLMLTASPT